MSDLIVPEQKQIEAKKIDWSKDQIARLWVETSMRLRTLERSDIYEELSKCTGKSKNALRIWYYRHMVPHDFDSYWMEKYQAYHRMRLGPKTYARMNDLVDKERDLDKLVNVLDHIEGKQDAPAVQINQFIKTEKDIYGI